MKLKTKLSLAMAVLALLVCIVGVFSLYQMARVNDVSTEIATNWLPSCIKIQRMNTLSSDYRTQEIQHVYSVTAEELAKREKAMEVLLKEFNKYDKEYAPLISSADEQRTYDEFKKDWRAYLKLHERIFALSKENRTEEAVSLLHGESKDVFDNASALLLELVQINIEGGGQASAYGDELYGASKTLVTVVIVIAVIIAVVLAVFLVRGVLRQLGKDPGDLQSIAQRVTQGDYDIDDGSQKIGVYGNIVEMVTALREHIENARRESERAAEESRNAQEAMRKAEAASAEAQSKTEAMLKAADKLDEVAHIVSSASSELSAQIEQSERGAAEQAVRVTETATAMEEMNSTVIEVAKNAGAASEVSAQTREKADTGAGVVRKAVESIQQVQKESLALKEDMLTLGEHAQSISQIMGVISDIADQTNLLALNAAIEAARAGEAGRGFAVVADEVRKLAEKTMASTTDVGNAIKAIQQSADKSMAQVDRAVKVIEEATEYAHRSGLALEEIVAMADSTADQVRAIATASEQQSASSEEINHSINQVNTIAGETSRAMEEATKAVSELAEQAHTLAALIEDMKRG